MSDDVSYTPKETTLPPAASTPVAAAPAPATPTSPHPEKEPPASAASADNEVKKSLRGTLLGQLLDIDQDPETPAAASSAIPENPAEAVASPAGAALPSTPAPTTPAAPKKKKVEISRAQPQPQVDVAQIATAAANAAVEAQRRMQEDEYVRRSHVEMPQEVKKYASVYQELHQANPSKYPPDLTVRMARFVNEEKARAVQWEHAHPGESYDSEAEEHAAWYNANQPNIDEEDFADARVTARAREIVEREIHPRTEKLQRQVERQQLQPVLEATAKTLGVNILKAVVPDFDGTISKESVEKIKTADPIAFDVASSVDESFAKVVLSAGLLWNGMEEFNDKNNIHQASRQILSEFESGLAELKPSELIRKGKKWAPLAEFSAMSKAQREGHYTVEYQDFVNYVRDHVAPNEAKRIYEEQSNQGKTLVEKLAGKYGYQKANPPNPAVSATNGNGSSTHVASSPAIGAGTPPAAPGASRPESEGSFEDVFFKRLGLP